MMYLSMLEVLLSTRSSQLGVRIDESYVRLRLLISIECFI